jgi:hypothetical protein
VHVRQRLSLAAFVHEAEPFGYRATARVADVHADLDAVGLESIERQPRELLHGLGHEALTDRRAAQPVADFEASNRPVDPMQPTTTHQSA